MTKPNLLTLFFSGLFLVISNHAFSENVAVTSNGISFPSGMKNWRIIGTSYRQDNNTQRAILGNSIAIKAARSGQIMPWPQGTILAKLVWKNSQHPQWDDAIVPGEFVHAEIMIKDSIKFASTKGWGFARWLGKEQVAYGEKASFAQACLSCHTRAKNTDYVFTIPATIP